MLYKEIQFTIQAEKEFNDTLKEHEIDFLMEFDENWECTNAESRNPCSTWTNYVGWHQGWMEVDEDLEALLAAIKEYSTSMDCEQLIAEMEITDINYQKEIIYTCTDYVEGTFTFHVTCTSIETAEY